MEIKMTTPMLGRLRLATLQDVSDIFELINESMAKNFRIRQVFDIIVLIESCTLSIVQLNDKNVIVGFLAAKDHPLLPSVHPSAWEHYIWTKYKTIEMTARNTLFIHLLCWSKLYGREVVDSLLKSLFMHDSYLMNVAFIKCMPKYPMLMPGQSRCEGSFRRVSAAERGLPPDLVPSLCLAERSEVCPRLRVRRAVEEDNDDLVPIIEQHSKRLREMYGEFYISELISRHPESERVLLVGERQELAIGVMILNTMIDYESLEESFDLSPFAGLRHLGGKPVVQYVNSSSEILGSTKPERRDSNLRRSGNPVPPCDKAEQKTKIMMTFAIVNIRFILILINRLRFLVFIISHNLVLILNKVYLSIYLFPQTLNWGYEASQWESEEVVFPLPMVDNDDDLGEYDIVNITNELMRIPRPLSVELNIVFELPTPFNKTIYLSHRLKSDRTLQVTTKEMLVAQDLENNILKPKKAVSTDKIRPRSAFEIVRYSGTPNAFLLEVFAMHPDYDERYGYDILQTAFEMFPDRDYCVLCLPSNQPAFPLLEHFTLVTPKHYREKYTSQSLYVAHVNTVRESVAVRPAEAFDFPSMAHILEHVYDKQNILRLLERSLVSDDLDAYVLLSQRQAVGVVILESLDNCVGVRTQYDLEPEPRSAGTDGAIIAGILSPALEPHARWYLRDLIRHSKFYHLFWPSQLNKTGKVHYSSRNVMSLAGRMVPIVPYRHHVPNITGIKYLDKVRNSTKSCALFGIETHLTALPKVDVNHGIVVVGASRTGLAFIETLLMGPASRYLTFTNITLVSEHGLPMLCECIPAAETCVPRSGRYTDRYLKSLPLYYYVDCITGVMVEIDRKKKFIRLQGGAVKYYDELVLTCGQQFQHPDYLAESFAHSKKMSKGKPCERILMDNPKYRPDKVPPRPDLPDNVFVINSMYEANICLRRLMSMVNARTELYEIPFHLSAKNRVIVYGDHLESYSTMAALLELGITPKEIAFVEPFPPVDRNVMRVNCFNDELIDERVQASLDNLGIYVYRKCHFVSWQTQGTRITSLDVMSSLHRISIPCFALFYYGLKAINYYAFKAISECGLVYDGGLVVDTKFKTNDAHVYGAGTCVQYSRRLRADRQLHRDRCSEDVGEALANIFLRQMDPFVMADPESDLLDPMPRYRSSLLTWYTLYTLYNIYLSTISLLHFDKCLIFFQLSSSKHRNRWEPVMEFESPLLLAATFPGPLYYSHLKSPGVDIPMEVRLTLPHQGHSLITDKDGNYFQLQLDEFHCIDGATCLAKKVPCYDILAQIHGMHESLFNNLLARFMMNKIDDFYEFFMQPWMSALYQETFGNLLRHICQQNVGTVITEIFKTFLLLFPVLLTKIDGQTIYLYRVVSCIIEISRGPDLKCCFDISYLGTKLQYLTFILQVYDLVKSHFSLITRDDMSFNEDGMETSEKVTDTMSCSTIHSCYSEPGCFFCAGDAPNLGTVRSVIERFIPISTEMNEGLKKHLPSECGQSTIMRNDAKAFWHALGGDRIVTAHLAHYFDRNRVLNPQYANIRPDLI
ncbi:cilia- and flagella-associated protein 61-like [Cydia pomonella]|uniref:cilia- and flagella-associated protein 61-like n=1 Tax=Cydia pomonella TaxID=82600 RepID=UPI002ADDEDF2|nr:cilia- and flagella-associated protein 61-like [Cydia pomonella]